jgi:tetratricopeptide (TPR) repeat protein
MRSRRSLVLFLAALAVRLLHLAALRDLPTFDVPLVDGANYLRMAEAIAAGDLAAGRQVFWQPPLYPYFLALLLALCGPRWGILYTIQSAVGALSCVLVFAIGRRVLGERAGLAAGGIMAFYGPLIFFDTQPLIPVLHLVLMLGAILCLLRARSGRGRLGAGLLLGLSAIATPNVLFAAPPAMLWLARAARRSATPGFPAPRRAAAGAVLPFLLGVALPVGAVAARNLAVAGEAVLISGNGGINFYIGNNPDYERTLRIRPGGGFERLAQEPENLGITGAAAKSRHFAGRALRFLTGYPGAALRLYGRKLLDLIAGREIPRNQDMYEYRRHSPVLALLLWRFGVSFPFGLLAPLALAGLVAWRAGGGRGAPPPVRPPGAGLLLGWAAAYAASILIFFPTDRYRLPLVPILALFAGALAAPAPAATAPPGGREEGRGRPPWRRPAVLAALAAGLVLFNLDALHPGERFPEEEALNRAQALRVKGRPDEARREYGRAIALRPERIDAHNSLGAMAAQDGRWEEAARHYEEVVRLAPDFVDARRNLGQAWLSLGRTAEARREWEIAANLAPAAGLALADLCLSYLSEGAVAAAQPYCERAVRARPDLGETHLALGLLARAQRRREVARAAFTEAAGRLPPGSAGWRRATEILERMRRRDRARETGGAPVPED